MIKTFEMTSFETKLREFREAFRYAVLNQEVPMRIVECEESSYYTADFYVRYDGGITTNTLRKEIHFAVAPSIICYHEPLIEGIFRKKDFPKLNKIIESTLSTQDAQKRKRIRELEKELRELKEAI